MVRCKGKKYIQNISFKPEGKKPLERPSLRCEDKFRLESGFEDWLRKGSGTGFSDCINGWGTWLDEQPPACL
jgi:hypothetical protein